MVGYIAFTFFNENNVNYVINRLFPHSLNFSDFIIIFTLFSYYCFVFINNIFIIIFLNMIKSKLFCKFRFCLFWPIRVIFC